MKLADIYVLFLLAGYNFQNFELKELSPLIVHALSWRDL